MKMEHFHREGKPGISGLVENVQESSDDALESVGADFAFPVPKKVRDMEDIQVPVGAEGSETISTSDLLRVTLRSLRDSWEQSIEPRIGAIRNGEIKDEERKEGNDFFTEADVESERLIVNRFTESFGGGKVRFFGEEAAQYTGNPDANITVRIDPIDGTHTFKFGKQDWCTMVGVYQGSGEAQKQIVAGIYAPERNELFYYVKDVGAFAHTVDTGESEELLPIEEQNDIRNLIVSFYAHPELPQRGKDEEILKALDERGATTKMFSSGTEVLEALLTRGKRILIFDGDLDQSDYIPYPMLVQAGYKIYEWGSDEEIEPEDPSLANKKVIIVPPGIAGAEARDLIKKAYSTNHEEHGSGI